MRVQASLPFNPDQASRASPPRCRFNTAVSFVTNTNWQRYARRIDDEPPHPDGRARRAEVRLGRGGMAVVVALHPRARPRRGSAPSGTSGSTSSAPRSGSCCPLSFVFAIVFVTPGRDPEPRTASPTVADTITGSRPRRSPAARSPAGGDQGARRRTAAASSTPTRRTRSRTRTSSATSSRSTCSSSSRSPCAFTFGKMVRDQATGLGGVRRMFVLWLGASVGVVAGFEANGNPQLNQPRREPGGHRLPGRRQHGRQGGTRFGAGGSALCAASTTSTSTGSVNSTHDSFTPARRRASRSSTSCSARSTPGGVGVRPLRDADLRAARRCSSPASWSGEHRSISARRSRRAEMKLVVALHPRRARSCVAGRSPRSRRRHAESRHASISTRARTASPRSSTRITSAANNNGSAFAGLRRAASTGTHHAGHRHARRPVLPDDPGAGHRRLAGAQAARCPRRAGTFPTDTPLFVALLVVVIVIVVGLTLLSSGARARPDRRHLKL